MLPLFSIYLFCSTSVFQWVLKIHPPSPLVSSNLFIWSLSSGNFPWDSHTFCNPAYFVSYTWAVVRTSIDRRLRAKHTHTHNLLSVSHPRRFCSTPEVLDLFFVYPSGMQLTPVLSDRSTSPSSSDHDHLILIFLCPSHLPFWFKSIVQQSSRELQQKT